MSHHQRYVAQPRPWKPHEEAFVREHAGKLSHAQIGLRLGRTAKSITSWCKSHRVSSGRRFWTPVEDEIIRQRIRKLSARTIGESIDRTPRSIWQRARTLGLSIPQRIRAPGFVEFLRAKHALGWSDAQIAAEWGRTDRHAVAHLRRKLGLPSVLHSEHQRRRVAEKTRRQIAQAGLPSIGHLRVEAFRRFARESGWPAELQMRETQILNALWDHGPQTKRELAARVGAPWKGSKKTLCGNLPGGSYLATLIRRGLVISLGRIAWHPACGKGNRAGQGKNVEVYSLAPNVSRQPGPWMNQSKEQIDEHERTGEEGAADRGPGHRGGGDDVAAMGAAVA